MKSKVTIKQIARESGVSPATVSRYLNGTVAVSEEKRLHIEAAIKKYHFSPNTHARSLISGRTMILGILIPDISNPYFYSLFQEIQKEVLQNGYTLLLYNTGFPKDKSFYTEEYYFRLLLQHRTDGVLVLGGQADLCSPSSSYIQALSRLGEQLPVVVMGNPIPNTQCQFLNMEDGSGITAVFKYLYSLGHRKIAFLGGNSGVHITETRLFAYRRLLSSHNLPEDSRLIVLSDYYAENGYQAALLLLKKKAPFTAVIAANDNVAAGAIRAFSDRGYQVPQNISVASCDHFPSGSYFVPRITGAVRDARSVGQILIHTLLRAIRGEEKYTFQIPSSKLLILESCQKSLIYTDFERNPDIIC